MLWRAWSDGVVPLRMELVALDVEACHLLVSHLDPFRIAPRVQHAVHYQPARRRGRGNQIYDGRSFFLVSTEITGWPASRKVQARALMWANWLSRSGWRAPS